MGLSQWNQYRLLASLYSVSQTHIQDFILITMGMTFEQLERWVDNTWIYTGIMLSMGIVSFNLGMLIGWIWVSL